MGENRNSSKLNRNTTILPAMKFLFAMLVLLAALVFCAAASEPKIAAPQDSDCNLELGLQCAGALAQCFPQCKEFKSNPDACFSCLGGSVATCCPCFKKAFGPNFPC